MILYLARVRTFASAASNFLSSMTIVKSGTAPSRSSSSSAAVAFAAGDFLAEAFAAGDFLAAAAFGAGDFLPGDVLAGASTTGAGAGAAATGAGAGAAAAAALDLGARAILWKIARLQLRSVDTTANTNDSRRA